MDKMSSFLSRLSKYNDLTKHTNQTAMREVAFQNLISVASVISLQISISIQDSYNKSVAYLHLTLFSNMT